MGKQEIKVITDEDLKQLKNNNRCCLLINDLIYDVTEFQEHPGGFSVLQELEGTDATKAFNDIGHSNEAKKMMKKYLIGVKKNTTTYKNNISTKTEKGGQEFICYSEEEIESDILEEDDEEIYQKPENGKEKNNYYMFAAVVFTFSVAYYFIFLRK